MFTFITLTYNHENHILVHLESIKYLVLNFAKKFKVSLIIIDDYSSDQTPLLIEEWVSINNQLFFNIEFVKNSSNRGINYNYSIAIKKIKTPYFKFLAGDDFYYKNNIFEVMHLNYDFLTSPTIVKEHDYYYLNNISPKSKTLKRAKSNVLFGNIFSAPSVFFNQNIIDDDYHIFITKYRNFEDYPSWIYFFVIKNCIKNYMVIKKPYVVYQSRTGISNAFSSSSTRDVYKQDLINFKDEYSGILKTKDSQAIKFKKYLIPVNYVYKIKYFIRQFTLKHSVLTRLHLSKSKYHKHYLELKQKAEEITLELKSESY